MRDKRVHPLIKALPFLSLIYLIAPDLLPGPYDDAVMITLFLQLFLTLIPDELKKEHRVEQGLNEQSTTDEDDIIEGEFWEE
jgi:hypothetical protein